MVLVAARGKRNTPPRVLLRVLKKGSGVPMKTKAVALSGLLCVAAAAPAVAGEGFYVGLGAGWAGQSNINLSQLTPSLGGGQVTTDDGVLVAGSLGYKLPELPIRIEFESGYDFHSVSTIQFNGVSYSGSGHNDIASELFNAIYDFPVAPQWNISVGGGLGPGHVHFAPTISSTGEELAAVDHWSLMWQLIGGVSYEVAPDADIFLEYRYRDARARATTFAPGFGITDSGETTENVVMAGARFYMWPGIEESNPP